MKPIHNLFFLLGLISFNLLFTNNKQLKAQSSPYIHVDQFGYQTNGPKVAVLSNPVLGYNSADSYVAPAQLKLYDVSSGTPVANIPVTSWNAGAVHSQSGDAGYWADFSSVTTQGSYKLYDPLNGEISAEFEISDNPYIEVLKASVRMFYYNRCNHEKLATHAGANWADGTNFLNPLQDANCRYVYDPADASLEKDLSGGWFDAGDYNKYVTFAFSAVHDLLYAYEENPAAFEDDWNIPESGNGLADLLDEVKWELDWLLKMCNPDGSVHIKMGSISYSDNVAAPPSANVDQRYYGPTCSAASIAAASMLSHAARVYGSVGGYSAYANTLESQAVSCYTYAKGLYDAGGLEIACDDGSILSGDADWDVSLQEDNLVAAAAQLYALTGNTVYENFFLANYANTEPINAPFWGPYKMPLTDALLLYANQASADPTAAAAILSAFQTDVSNNFSAYFGFNADDLYRGFMPDWSYHWGSNSPKAGYGVLNMNVIAQGIDPANNATYEQAAYEILHYFHGVNPQGMVQLSNMSDYGAENSANEIYHTWFADGSAWDDVQTSTYGPAPGFLVGGANSYFSVPTLTPPYGQPLMKSYLDFNDDWPNNSWEITEPAIYYQAAYVRLLASFVNKPAACTASTNVSNLTATLGATNLNLSWDAVPGSVGCQIGYGPLAGSFIGSQNILGADLDAASVPLSIIPSGSFKVRVRCACEIDPSIIATGYSNVVQFNVPTPRLNGLSDFLLSPNPVNDQMTISFDATAKQPLTISILNVLGSEIYHKMASSLEGYNQLQLDLSTLENGMYFLQLTSGESTISEQFEVVK